VVIIAFDNFERILMSSEQKMIFDEDKLEEIKLAPIPEENDEYHSLASDQKNEQN